MNILNLLNMGTYTVYVWSAYGFTFMVFGINLFLTFRQKNKTKKLIQQFLQTPPQSE